MWAEPILRARGAVLRKKPSILLHIYFHPQPTPFCELFLQRPETHRQTLNQGELLASVLGQKRNEELSQLIERTSVRVSVREGFLEEDKAEHRSRKRQ